MAATIKIKNSSTASAVPTSSDLVQGELAVNVTDKRIFTENASGTVVELGTNPSILTLPDGSASAPTLTNDGDTNTGLFFPAADTVGITTGGTERARVDSSGNLGLGVTPTNNTLGKTLQVGQAGAWVAESGSNRWWLANNWYYNSGDKYINNGYATLYSQQNGSHQWQIAASGTAGNAITFTQAMTLDASGNFMVGGTGYTAAKITSVQQSDTAGTLSFGLGAGGGISQGLRLTTGNALAFDRYNGGWYESARINSSGQLLVGTTTGTDVGRVVSSGVANSYPAFRAETGATTSQQQISFVNPNGIVGTITTSGSATAYNTSSDYRLKNTISPMTGALAKVAALKPVTYKWKIDGSDGQGFIAHELQSVVPECVIGEKDAVDADGNPVYQGIDTSFLVATLTAAIQEQQAIITQLQADVAALKGQA
jgi:hypothetical protein